MLGVVDKLSFQRVMDYYDFYTESQWWPIERLIDYQSNRIRYLITTAYNEVSFYKEIYEKKGISPKNIKNVNDLYKLPIVTKEQLKSAYPSGCTRKARWPVREYFTSGSSGNPFAVQVDSISMSQARALMLLRANYGGWKFGDPILQTGMSLNRGIVKKVKDIFFGVYYVSAFDLSDDNLDRYLYLILNKKIKFLMGYPGSIYALSMYAEKQKTSLTLEGIITWGDNLYNHFRKKIESQFSCKVTDSYGCGEGIQVAAQCPDGHGGYHIFMPHVIVEVVDDYGAPVKRGEMGNLLLTRLTPGAMPLIRYKVGDVGRLSKESACACGRGYEILEKIEGRDSDFIYTPNGNKLIVHFFTGIFEYYPDIKEFCVVQNELDKINIEIVPEKKFNKSNLKLIENEIKDKGDESLRINFEIVDKIEHKHGKRKFVKSTINRT
jgi:phenylacetate-CoA ligase